MELSKFEEEELEYFIKDDIENIDNIDITMLIELMNWYDCLVYFDEVTDSLDEYYNIDYVLHDFIDYESLAEASNYHMLSNGLVMWQSLWLDLARYEDFIYDYKNSYGYNIQEMAEDLDIPCEV